MKLFRDTFFKDCVLKLGSIYILLVILGFIFLEYRTSQSMSWANGLVFATHDKISFSIFSLIFITFIYGFYYWIKAFFKFVLNSQISIPLKFTYTMYLVSAPIIATAIVYEIFSIF
jgi:hypothetical protein